jgi:hypothetical protein
MENYTIHRLEKENFECLIPLMQNCFGMEVDISYFKWKYMDNPDGFVRGYYAKSSTNEIAAYYGVIPQMISYFGEEKLIFQSCDTMTHSKHRRKGLFQELAKHCYNELEQENQLFIIGFGGSESTPGFLKFGWKHLFDCKNYFYPKLFSFFNWQRKDQTILDIPVEEISKIKHLISPPQIIKIQTFRHHEKYVWRLKNPLHHYKIVTKVSEDSKATSFIIYFISKNTIQLFDYHFGNKKEARQLIQVVLSKENKKQNIKGILAFCQENGRWSKTLQKIGFITNPFSKGPLAYKTPFITFTNIENQDRMHLPSYWNISSFDHDSL